jgi:hypothetical protein
MRTRRFALMQKVEDYRNHADECRAMARRSRTPEERTMLLNMAKTWDNLASHRAEQIARKQRLRDIETGAVADNRASSIPIEQLNASNDE